MWCRVLVANCRSATPAASIDLVKVPCGVVWTRQCSMGGVGLGTGLAAAALLTATLSGCGSGDSTVAKTPQPDRKSTRLNSSHQIISYAVFCLKKKKK